jgi:HPt (histidine-containing phosphotransfer) domain-containing protein
MVAERTEQLHEKTVDIQAMLQNMRQGILMIQPNGLVHPEYSRFLEQILETKDIAGKAALPLILDGVALGSDAQDSFETAVASCIGEDSMNFSFNGHLLITECDKRMPDGRIKALNLGWSPICSDDDVVDKLMVVIRDVTELRRLEAEAGQQKRELEMIGQILTVNQEKFHEFVDSARGFVKENEALLHAADERHPDLISQLFRNMHTIKGNARTYGLLHLTNLVHEAEQTYDELRHDPDKEFDKQTLMSHLKDVLTSIEEYASLNEIKLGRKGPGRRGSAERYVMAEKMHIDAMLVALIQAETAQDADSLRAALKQAQLGLQVIGTEPIQSVLDGVFASLPSLAKELDKEPPQLVVRDHGIVIRNQIADLLRNVFVHLYRNSLDHGIERPAERASQGKPAFGMIELALELTHGRLIFRLRDDGRGLALKFIRQKAVEKGLIDEKSDMPDDAVAQLIFASGFSTADAVTEVSGRGVGMDAVKDFVQREGGTIVLSFTDEKAGADFRAFETVISMPEHFAVATH